MAYSRQLVALGVSLTVLAPWYCAPQERVQAGSQGAITAVDPPLTQEQIQALIARTAQSQHANDHASEEFERFEHVVAHKVESAEILSDRTLRIVPFGSGTLKLPVADKGVPESAEDYRSQLEYAVSVLDRANHPDGRSKQDLAKFQRRSRERSELVDEASKAFRVTWAGRETRGGRTFVKLLLNPDPNYKPPTRLAVVFQHVRATLWLDEAQAQIGRLEAVTASDVYFSGGIVGKIDQGGHFTMEQSEAAPGVWLPTMLLLDVDGRKFLFAFGIHERTEITRYRRVGPPSQAIEIIRAELNNQSAGTPAH